MHAPLPDPQRTWRGQDKVILHAQLVWGEARGESSQTKLAVAYTPINRLASRRFGGSFADVVLAPYQFSCFRHTRRNFDKSLHPLRYDTIATWDACYEAARLAQIGRASDPGWGAVFCHDTSLWYPPRAWGKVVLTAALGHMRFYKWA